ncbi:hypothetical protein AABB24_018446 [Solanum stoloniferum]|uniref:Uncharacterized protein n=1 Tax=Solanum stoloniferum TaxID=62892 RepID=A0ABD2TBX7_9SOLN
MTFGLDDDKVQITNLLFLLVTELESRITMVANLNEDIESQGGGRLYVMPLAEGGSMAGLTIFMLISFRKRSSYDTLDKFHTRKKEGKNSHSTQKAYLLF